MEEKKKKKSDVSKSKKKTSTSKKKKTDTIKRSEKEESIKSVKKDEVKKETGNNFSVKLKKIVTSYAFLYSVFAILVVCVAVLGGVVYVKGREYKKNSSNIVVPILEDGTRSALNIDLNQLKKTGEYVVKITNYRGDKINSDSLDYSITVRNASNADIKVTKDEDTNNLIVDKEATIIEGVGFGTSKKEEDVYRFTVSDDSKIEKDALISLEIVAQKRPS